MIEPSIRQKTLDYNNAVELSKSIISNKGNYLILDTETTGLGENDVIIQIGIVDLDGNTKFDSLVRPTKRKRISSDATWIHGYKMADLKNSPTMAELWLQINEITSGKELLIFNASFDERLLDQTCAHDNIRPLRNKVRCLMTMCSYFNGEWNHKYGNYRYPKLEGGDHSATGDCNAALSLLNLMANSRIADTRKKW